MLRRPSGDDMHLRQLLAARTVHAAALANYDDDSPSVYSSPFFSPRPSDALSPHTHTAPFEARTRLNELAESMLDLDDDSRTPSDDDEDDDAPATVEADHDSDDPRLSMLGPKMRFHGKAPWEMDDALEEDEDLDPERSSSRGRDAFKKGLGFRSASRGTTASSRPSGESSRSARPKRSFETTSSANSPYSRGGALHALGQASLSSTSLVPRQAGLRLNFPLADSSNSHYATPPRSPRSLTSPHSNTSSPGTTTPEYAHFPSSNRPHLARRGTNDSAASKTTYSEELHPYANPDLVVSYAEDPSPTPSRATFNLAPTVSRSDSTTTVTETLPTATSLTRSVTGSTLTTETSASSMSPSQSPRSGRASLFHGREISSPIPMHPSTSSISTAGISSPLMAPSLPLGWTERSASPTFALISLEEARAQRTRSATAQNPSVLSSSSSFAPFPEAPSAPESHDHSPSNSISSRARARSISTGARAKAALQSMVGTTPAKPERRDSEPIAAAAPTGPTGRTVKHKKSGFMRLFNGGVRGEKEGRESPPPVPSLSDGYAAFNAGARAPKVPMHRVPPPPVSPSMFHSSEDLDHVSPSSTSSSRPTPPPLSIRTGSHARLRAASAAEDFQTRTVPSDVAENWHQLDLPQSAPPNITEFPALKLRPVSTMFSAHFGDHMVLPSDSERQPSLDADADTLSSTSPTSITPITPGVLHRHNSSDKDRLPMATISEDQSLVQSLQEQLASSKKAWQRHIWELEGQVRDLKAEVESLRKGDGGAYCETCGRGSPAASAPHDHRAFTGVVNRPRARTGTSSRFGSAV